MKVTRFLVVSASRSKGFRTFTIRWEVVDLNSGWSATSILWSSSMSHTIFWARAAWSSPLYRPVRNLFSIKKDLSLKGWMWWMKEVLPIPCVVEQNATTSRLGVPSIAASIIRSIILYNMELKKIR